MDQPEIIFRKEAKARGLKRYFTGKPCNHGHIAERHTASGRCCECNILSLRGRRHEDRDLSNSLNNKWRRENRDRVNSLRREWSQKNTDAVRARNQKSVVELDRSYIAGMLHIPVAQLSEELYAMKREQIEFHRLQIELNRELKRLTK